MFCPLYQIATLISSFKSEMCTLVNDNVGHKKQKRFNLSFTQPTTLADRPASYERLGGFDYSSHEAPRVGVALGWRTARERGGGGAACSVCRPEGSSTAATGVASDTINLNTGREAATGINAQRLRLFTSFPERRCFPPENKCCL